jgi:hypothetical protein
VGAAILSEGRRVLSTCLSRLVARGCLALAHGPPSGRSRLPAGGGPCLRCTPAPGPAQDPDVMAVTSAQRRRPAHQTTPRAPAATAIPAYAAGGPGGAGRAGTRPRADAYRPLELPQPPALLRGVPAAACRGSPRPGCRPPRASGGRCRSRCRPSTARGRSRAARAARGGPAPCPRRRRRRRSRRCSWPSSTTIAVAITWSTPSMSPIGPTTSSPLLLTMTTSRPGGVVLVEQRHRPRRRPSGR